MKMHSHGSNLMELHRLPYTMSDDPARVDRETIHRFLSIESYWAQGRSREIIEQSIENSLVLGIYTDTEQVAFARVVTDYATFAWVCDVYVDERHRGHGLGKWLMETIIAHPRLTGIKRLVLGTRDAHGLYKQYGFESLKYPERWMMRNCEENPICQ